MSLTAQRSHRGVDIGTPRIAAGVDVRVRRVHVDPTRVALVAITLMAAALQLWKFAEIPNGLNQDEISAGYESFSLLTTGADRWGAHLPAYFLSWGSGQNVLYSYLAIPFIHTFGLTALGLRMVGVIVGVLTVPVMFFTVRAWYGKRVAWTAAGIAALCPWLFMASRWGLESNLLPFFILLGFGSFTAAFREPRPVFVVLCLAPFALALYAYALGVFAVVAALGYVTVVVWRARRDQPIRLWLGAYALCALMALPFATFLARDYLGALPQHLPFSVPMLADSRASQIGFGPSWQVFAGNVRFALHGFSDGYVWNAVPGHAVFPVVVLIAAGVGVGLTAVRDNLSVSSPYLWWLLSGVALFVTTPLDVNRANQCVIPLIVFAAVAVNELFAAGPLRRAMPAAFAAVYAASVVPTIAAYFGPEYAAASAENFNPGFGPAIREASQIRPSEPLFITSSISLNYVQTLWYLRVPPAEFQHSRATVADPDFGRYRFSKVPTAQAFVYVIRTADSSPCAAPNTVWRSAGWEVGTCSAV